MKGLPQAHFSSHLTRLSRLASLTVVGLLLLSPLLCHSAPLGGISGVYFKNDEKHPFPGALIALYNEDANVLVDFTYTTNDGRFTLKSPQQAGKYYIVATKDGTSQRQDIEYDPQSPNINVPIKFSAQESSLSKTLDYVSNVFNDIYKTLLGLFIGLWFARGTERRKTRDEFDRDFGQVRVSAEKMRLDLEELVPKMLGLGGLTGNEKERLITECDVIKERVETSFADCAKRLAEKKNDLEREISKLYGTDGLNELYRLDKALRDVSEFVGKYSDIAQGWGTDRMKPYLEPLPKGLRNFLIADYRTWFTRLRTRFRLRRAV
jgi:hypothetical protein